MSERDLLSVILERADASEPRFFADEVTRWPEGIERQLMDAGIIRRDDNATCVVCDACDEGHVEEVATIVGPAGSPPRAFIHCPDAGRVAVPLERLNQWVIDFQGLASAISRGLNLTGTTDEVVPGRLWTFGIAPLGGRSREVFLARGLSWIDGADIVGKCGRLTSGQSVVFVPASEPPNVIWKGDPPVIASLLVVARMEQGCLVLDRDHLEGFFAQPMIGLAERYPKDRRIFRNQGKTWLVVYDGVPRSVNDTVGMTYISCLLRNPGQDIHSATLCALNGGDGAAPFLGSAGNVLDDNALKDYREHLKELEEEIREAETNNDIGRLQLLKDSYEAVTTEIGRATGLGGRRRKAADDRERARQAASVAIHRALRAIKKEHEVLWPHLHNSLNIGEFLSYRPDQPTSWVT